MKVKLNDKVLITTGKDKGKTGNIIRIIKKNNKIVVGKVNMRIKHIKKTAQKAGEKITFEAPFHVSNVMIICPNCSKESRVGYKILPNGKKDRICKKCQNSLNLDKSKK